MVDAAHQSRDQGPKQQHHPSAHHLSKTPPHACNPRVDSVETTRHLDVLTWSGLDLDRRRKAAYRIPYRCLAKPACVGRTSWHRVLQVCKSGEGGYWKRGVTIHHEHHHHKRPSGRHREGVTQPSPGRERQIQPHGCVDRAVTCKKPPLICYDLDERNHTPPASQLAVVELNAQSQSPGKNCTDHQPQP